MGTNKDLGVAVIDRLAPDIPALVDERSGEVSMFKLRIGAVEINNGCFRTISLHA